MVFIFISVVKFWTHIFVQVPLCVQKKSLTKYVITFNKYYHKSDSALVFSLDVKQKIHIYCMRHEFVNHYDWKLNFKTIIDPLSKTENIAFCIKSFNYGANIDDGDACDLV